jgi:hypothetical protein
MERILTQWARRMQVNEALAATKQEYSEMWQDDWVTGNHRRLELI